MVARSIGSVDPQPVNHLPAGRAADLLRFGELLLFVVLVPLAAIRALAADGEGDGGAVPVVSVGAAILLWYGWGKLGRRREGPAGSVWPIGLVLLTLIALWISPDFAWVSFGVFVALANLLRPRRAVVAVLAVALLTGALLVLRWPGDSHPLAPLIGPVVGALAVLVLVGSARMAASEAAERQRLVDELMAARDRLALVNLAAGVRAERERLSREIHDTIAQDLTSIVLTARRSLRSLDQGETDRVRDDLEVMADAGGRGVEAARRLVRELPPAELEHSPLSEVLGAMADPDRTDGPAVEVRIEEAHGIGTAGDPAVDAALLRIAQEAVSNARRHAGADRIVVTVTRLDGFVSLDVTDDGIGFDPMRVARDRFGLVGMRGRAESLGGTLSVDSSADSGTAVNATIPVPTVGAHHDEDGPGWPGDAIRGGTP